MSIVTRKKSSGNFYIVKKLSKRKIIEVENKYLKAIAEFNKGWIPNWENPKENKYSLGVMCVDALNHKGKITWIENLYAETKVKYPKDLNYDIVRNCARLQKNLPDKFYFKKRLLSEFFAYIDRDDLFSYLMFR